MAKGTWKEPIGAELVAPFINKDGSFKPPKRQAFESYTGYNDRYKKAKKLYDQHKGISHGSEVSNRREIRQHKLKIKEIAQLRNKINKLSLADESNIYAASLSIKTLGERLNKLEKSLKIKPSKIPTTQKGFIQLRENPLTGTSNLLGGKSLSLSSAINHILLKLTESNALLPDATKASLAVVGYS